MSKKGAKVFENTEIRLNSLKNYLEIKQIELEEMLEKGITEEDKIKEQNKKGFSATDAHDYPETLAADISRDFNKLIRK